jgi:WD40 repeat protein
MQNVLVSSLEEITPSLWGTLKGRPVIRANAVTWAATADGQRFLLSASDNGYTHLWNIRSGEPGQLFAQHDDWVLCVACATLPTGQILVATGGKDRFVRVWDGRSGRELRRLDGHSGAVNTVAWAVLADGQVLLASGSDDATARVWVWDGETGRELRRLSVGRDHVHLVHSAAWTVLPDGQLRLAAIADNGDGTGAVHLWDGLTGARQHILTIPPVRAGASGTVSGSVALVAGPGGRLLVAANPNAVAHVWDGDTGKPLYVAKGTEAKAVAWISTPAWGLVLLVAGENFITVLDSSSGQEIAATDVVNDGYFRSFAATSAQDGAILVAAAWKRDTPARIWRIARTH